MTKVCLNPACRKSFTPGHYGRRQKICGSPDCRAWYRLHWRATRRPPRGLPAPVYAKLLRAAKPWPVLQSLIVCARETGLRKGELLGLEWSDLDNGLGALRHAVEVRGQWRDGAGFCATKTRTSRLAMFSAAARRALAAYRLAGARGRVWPVSESWAWIRFTALQRAHNIKNPDTGQPYRFHDLRHMVGLELVRAGRLDLAQRMLGHKRLETTLIYAEQAPEDILADVERIRRRRAK